VLHFSTVTIALRILSRRCFQTLNDIWNTSKPESRSKIKIIIYPQLSVGNVFVIEFETRFTVTSIEHAHEPQLNCANIVYDVHILYALTFDLHFSCPTRAFHFHSNGDVLWLSWRICTRVSCAADPAGEHVHSP
jgi:hypothetical protein